jgi:hypothetical protein
LVLGLRFFRFGFVSDFDLRDFGFASAISFDGRQPFPYLVKPDFSEHK